MSLPLRLIGATLLAASCAFGQISPGELSTPHASLEGMQNCTKCHTLGQKTVSNDNCYACHTELRSRVAAGTGLHARYGSRQCVECHKEHHGRNFDVRHFDPKGFDHAAAGFVLEGKHRPLECAKCHTRGKITAPDVLKNTALLDAKTYLGLSRACLPCHVDTHRGQFKADCLSCHTMEGWKPVSRFSHEKTKYPLTGKHASLECGACHKKSADDGKTVKFAGIDFATCVSCHADPHKGKFQKPCESCHSTNGWSEGAAKNFNHATTRFPLKGQHATVRCERCHVPVRSSIGGKSSQAFTVKNFQKCSDCHADAHRGEFTARADGGKCESCHTEKGFAPAAFDHAKARYALKGKHENTPCAKCHGSPALDARGKRIPVDFRQKKFQACADCHAESHAGQFVSRSDKGACEACHAVTGFLPALYTVEAHGSTKFALAGGHVATACGKCHASNVVQAKSTRQFRWKEKPGCQKCHKDQHSGAFDKLMTNGCETCHGVEGWKNISFPHDATKFPLKGKHVGVPCAGCHKVVDSGLPGQRVLYAGVPTRCVDCHSRSDVAGSSAE